MSATTYSLFKIGSLTTQTARRVDRGLNKRYQDLLERMSFFRYFGSFEIFGKCGYSWVEDKLRQQAKRFLLASDNHRAGKAKGLCKQSMLSLERAGRKAWNRFLAMHRLAKSRYPKDTKEHPYLYFPRASVMRHHDLLRGINVKNWHQSPLLPKQKLNRRAR